MTVLQAIKDAAPWIGTPIPTLVYGSTDRTWVEMGALANEVAKQIAAAAQWSALTKIATITGNGSATDFPLPTDYGRMTKNADLRSASYPFYPLKHILSASDWLAITNSGIQPFRGIWILLAKRINILPVRGNGEAVKYVYISKNIVLDTNSVPKEAFTDDTDSFVLSERLLRLGIIWNWKVSKGTDYQEDLANFNQALADEIGDDRGPAAIAVGLPKFPSGAQTAYPYPLGP